MSHKNTVIVVDDDVSIVETFSELLEELGVKVVGKGYNGKDAVALYKEHKPDIVFLDLMMPEYDGFYALEKIKEFNLEAKIVVVTADIKQSSVTKLEEFKINTIIYKPIDVQKIIQIIKTKF